MRALCTSFVQNNFKRLTHIFLSLARAFSEGEHVNHNSGTGSGTLTSYIPYNALVATLVTFATPLVSRPLDRDIYSLLKKKQSTGSLAIRRIRRDP